MLVWVLWCWLGWGCCVFVARAGVLGVRGCCLGGVCVVAGVFSWWGVRGLVWFGF
ncbi:MAG: hypothetical protein HCTETUND1_087 [Candidatus Hodgkinia cicadicola]|nr:MAG: hypothetical protein HCTETUND1_087 [Candidatus Hodgkinia cicadicola]